MAGFSFVEKRAQEILDQWGLSGMVNSQTIADLVANGSAYWEQALPDGSNLTLIRLFSPVVRREEVFLGNILLNDFLSKVFIRAVEEGGLGSMQLLANDLENYYYLYHGQSTLEQMVEQFRQEVLDSLPELYFGDEDPSRAIYGGIERMLSFHLANREPFPVFVIPLQFLCRLLHTVNAFVRSLDIDSLSIQQTLAVLSFFYARGTRKVPKFDKKKGEFVFRSVSEMQSDFAFLWGAMEDGLLPHDELLAAFALAYNECFDEQVYRERKRGAVVDKEKFMSVVKTYLDNVEQRIAREDVHKVLAPLCKKMLDIVPAELAKKLFTGVQIAALSFAPDHRNGLPCRFCGVSNAVIREKTIVAGMGMTKFSNPAPKLPHPKQPGRNSLCMRCGISAYLETKLMGVMFAADMPIPRQYNILFHYGRHDDTEARRLGTIIDELFDLISKFQQKAREKEEFFSMEYVREQLANRVPNREVGVKELSDPEKILAALLVDEAVVPGLAMLGEMRREAQVQVLPLGMGDYRLLVFILPQFEPLVRQRDGRREEDWDFVPKRFSKSRLAAFTLLALLRKLCDCDGPFYFQSVPTLAPGGFDPNTFYVQGKAWNADEVLRRYSAIVNFARRVVKRRQGHSLLADWILLAERLEADATGTFSDILRRTPMRRPDFRKENRDKFEYRPLSKYETIDETGVIDGTEYLRLIEQLKQL